MMGDTDIYETTLLGRIDGRFFSNRPAKLGFAALAVIVMVVLLAQFLHKSVTPTSGFREMVHDRPGLAQEESIERTRGAFGRWMYDIRVSRQAGLDPYRDLWFPTPPLTLAVLTPFAFAPDWLGALLWAILKLTAAVAAVALTFKALSRADRPLPFGVGLTAVLFGLRPLVGDVQHGNVNILVLLPIAATLYLWVRGRHVAAGLCLGLAVALKLTPALLAVYYVYRRQWKVAAGSAAGLIVFAGVVPAAVFGPAKAVHYLEGWYGLMIEPVVHQGWVTYHVGNQSLPGTVLRWLVGSGAAEIERVDFDRALAYGSADLARPVQRWAAWVIKGAQFVLVASLAWLCQTRFHSRKDPRVGLEFALVLLAMLMLSERTWKQHCVTFVMVYAALWYGLACFQWSIGFRAAFASGLGVQFALLALSGEELFGNAVSQALLFGGVFLIGMMICFAQTAWLLKRRWEPLVTGP